jgi:hypothetical protein
MITYAEAQGEDPFDWKAFLEQPKKDIYDLDWDEASDRAMSWVTCMCGNQCDILPRTDEGRPIDDELAHLGVEFMDRIDNRQRKKALAVLYQIEQRSSILIKEILAKTNGQAPQEEQSV